jgi:hypothetical protein
MKWTLLGSGVLAVLAGVALLAATMNGGTARGLLRSGIKARPDLSIARSEPRTSSGK